MIYVGIDIAKQKHDCCIIDSEGADVRKAFSFSNNRTGFEELKAAILKCSGEGLSPGNVRVGFEATGHYGINLHSYLSNCGFCTMPLNAMCVKLYRQTQTLRKTKTDKTDARAIAEMLLYGRSNPTPVYYQNSELKSLTRHRFRLVALCSKSKIQKARLISILFPEIEAVISRTSLATLTALFSELPDAARIASCRIDRLANLIHKASQGRYGRKTAEELKALARESIGIESMACSLELQQVIEQIQLYNRQINYVEKQIKAIVENMQTKITSIPGIGLITGAVILAEIGDISRFPTPDKLQAFAGLDPSTWQSGKFKATKSPMVKRGSPYLRWAIMQSARLCTMYSPEYKDYLKKKIGEGKHYFVALGHLAKKLIRVIFSILNTNQEYIPKAA